MNWFIENLGNIIVFVILACAIVVTVRFLYKSKKNGKCVGCSSDCGSCTSCHGDKERN